MVLLELAKKLKDAGLKWEPKFCTIPEWQRLINEKHVYYPSLSQLLAEIEGRGYWPDSEVADCNPDKQRVYICTLQKWGDDEGLYPVYRKEGDLWGVGHLGTTREDAAAAALLWILEREKDD